MTVRDTVATAQQARPSPRPSAPSPSARLPLTLTGAPTTSLSRCSISARRGASFGRLGHDRAVDVAGLPAGRPDQADRVRQQLDAVGAGQARVVVGEQLADVAEAGRAEQGVGDGVGDGVGVAVAGQAARVGEADAAQHERPRRVRR